MKDYETVIGLEVHCELATKTKIFCGCSTAFGGEKNTHVCPVCAGMPGTLPVLNRKVVEFAVAAGLALNCTINQHCKFDRKNYFYPDLPKAYQISQLYLPVCRGGHLDIETENGTKSIGIHEIHMEEDAGKLVHDEWEDCTIVDFNRCGVPLIEIAGEADLRSSAEAVAYLEKLKTTLVYLGVSDCRMQEGSLRADINISVREKGSDKFGTRTEIKNLNSFKAIARAIDAERDRQIDLLEEGKTVVQETRRWDDERCVSYAMRNKEDAQDYRYFPDPDLPPVYISDEWIESIRASRPEMRDEKKVRYIEEFGLPEYDADILTGSRKTAELFEETEAICGKPKEVSNWLMTEAERLLKVRGMDEDDMDFSPENLAKLIIMLDEGRISRPVAKEVFEKIFTDDADPETYVEENGLGMMSDDEALRETIEGIVTANPQSVADYKAGKKKAIGFLVGQIMRAMNGKADPAAVNKILKEILER